MRWLLAVALFAVVALLAWLVVVERERAASERKSVAEAEEPHAAASEGAPDAPATKKVRPALALVQGQVRGRHGGIWGARITAWSPGRGGVLAKTSTNVEGRYAFEFTKGTVVDLLVEPGYETGLTDRWRDGVAAPAAVDFEYGHATKAEGRLRCVGWTRYAGIDLAAVPEERFVGWDDPGGLRVAATTRVRMTVDEAPFAFEGLSPGVYRLVSTANRWMLREPVRFTADEKGVEAVVVRALGVKYRVEDAALAVPVERFTVRIRFDERTVLTWEGRGGFLRRRVPHPAPSARPYGSARATVTVTAPGYLEEERPLGRGSGTVRLRPARDQNVFLRARYEDGADCAEALRGQAWREGVDPFGLGFERGADGRWGASLPPGTWTVVVWRDALAMPERKWLAVDIPADGEVERDVQMDRPGTLVLHGEPCDSVALERVYEDERPGGHAIVVVESADHECRLLPGRYRVVSRSGSKSSGEFDLKAGERIHVDVPREERAKTLDSLPK